MTWDDFDHCAILIIALVAVRSWWLSRRSISFNREAIECLLKFHSTNHKGGNFGEVSVPIAELAATLNLTPADIGEAAAQGVFHRRLVVASTLSGVRYSYRLDSN